MSLVLDSSATLAWIYQDEKTELALRIFEQVVAAGAWVPSLWRLEVANGLRTGLRMGGIDQADRAAALSDLTILRIRLDPETDRHAWTSTVQLSDRFNLTVYDAAYLELAQRRALPLATFDEPLRAAARACDVSLIGD